MAVVKKDKHAPKRAKLRRVAEPEDAPFTLTRELTAPQDDLGRAVILFNGEPKVGKTSLASCFGKTLIGATEIGYKGLEVFKEDLPTFARAQKLVRALRKDAFYNTLCLDTIDRLAVLSEKATCQELGIDDLADAEWGKGYSVNRRKLSDLLNDLTQTGKGLILISHAQEKRVETRTGVNYDRIVPTMSKTARELVEAMVDIWGYYSHDGKRRTLQIVGDDTVAAGHRFEHRFRTPDGRRLKLIDMGRSKDEAYHNFVEAFHNRYEPTREEDVLPTAKRLKRKRT